MSSDNWQDRLAALKASMPADDTPEPQSEQTHEARESAKKETLEVIFERKGRGGKLATIIEGFTIPDDEVEALASEMKRSLGTGGSVRDGEILIQGDRREQVRTYLKSKGFKTK